MDHTESEETEKYDFNGPLPGNPEEANDDILNGRIKKFTDIDELLRSLENEEGF